MKPFARQKEALEQALLSVDGALTSARVGINICYRMGGGASSMRIHAFGHPFELVVYEDNLVKFKDDVSALILMEFHELGHVLGFDGYRAKSGLIPVEGEADYLSGKLLRQFLESAFNLKFMDFRGPPQVRAELCAVLKTKSLGGRKYKSAEAAALAAFRLISATYPGSRIGFARRNTRIVAETIVDHLPAQIRLDTILAGILDEPRPASWAFGDDFKIRD